jgi:integrase
MGDSKSAAGIRSVWLTKHCLETLIRWRDWSGPQSSPYVFPSPRNPQFTSASRANGGRASGLTVAHMLDHPSTQILPTYVKPLDENTKAVIEALDLARLAQDSGTGSIHPGAL